MRLPLFWDCRTRSVDPRNLCYDHRLHGVLLVAQGMSCPEVAGLLGDAPRSVENWVRHFETNGLAGLQEGEHPGRIVMMGAFPRRSEAWLLAGSQVTICGVVSVGVTAF